MNDLAMYIGVGSVLLMLFAVLIALFLDKKEGVKYKVIGRVKRKKYDGFGGDYYVKTEIYSDDFGSSNSDSCDSSGGCI